MAAAFTNARGSTDQRTAIDFAQVVKRLVDVHYLDAERIVLVMDNLTTYTPGWFSDIGVGSGRCAVNRHEDFLPCYRFYTPCPS
jgi:hypothetical protein